MGNHLGNQPETTGIPSLVPKSKKLGEFADAGACELPVGVSGPRKYPIQHILAVEVEVWTFYVTVSIYSRIRNLLQVPDTRIRVSMRSTGSLSRTDWRQSVLMAYLSLRVTVLRIIPLKGDDTGVILELTERQEFEARNAFAAAF